MNIRSKSSPDGLNRVAFSVADVARMVEVGLIGEGERIELVEGELIAMSPKGARHETVKHALVRLWGRQCPDGWSFIPETTLRLSGDTAIEPDLLVFRAGTRIADLAPENILLAVEIADSSLRYDLGRKTELLAACGIAELWVIDANSQVIHVHRDPREGQYHSVTALDATQPAMPHHAPAAFAVRLADLRLED